MVELLISTALLMLLMTLIFSLYVNSHRAWKKSAEHQEVMGDLQVTIGFLSEELQRAPFDSLSIDTDKAALAFLSNSTDDGATLFTEDGRPLWHHWLLYYQAGSNLHRLSVPWSAPELDREFSSTLTAFSGEPLSFYRTGAGRILTRQLIEFQINNPPSSNLIEYSLKVHRKADANKIITLEGAISPRN